MDPFRVKDRILENISQSVKKLQSYFAACEDEAPAIRNHDRVLQRLCEHLDHALLYGLQDISLGYWVLVLHFTRKEAIQQIEGLQNIATHLGRSRAWLYLALSESSLESYLRLFQENQALLHRYYFKNALVCSHDHLALFLTLVSGLEFIRFDLELDVPYLDVAAYMPECYKLQSLLDIEERLPGCDSLSLHSINSANLEWDDSAIAPSSDDGEAVDSVLSGGSVGTNPKPAVEELKVPESSTPRSPTFRHGPFDEDSDVNTSTNVSPVHGTSRHSSTNGEDTESTGTELEVIRMAQRKKPGRRRHGKKSSVCVRRESPVTLPEGSPAPMLEESCIKEHLAGAEHLLAHRPCGLEAGAAEMRAEDMGDEDALLRLPEMTDTSMDSVGQPLREVMDQLEETLEPNEQVWDQTIAENGDSSPRSRPPKQQPFQGDPEGEPPDLVVRGTLFPQACGVAPGSSFLRSPTTTVDFYGFAPYGAKPAAQGSGYHDVAGYGQSQIVPGGNETEEQGEAPDGQDTIYSLAKEAQTCIDPCKNGSFLQEEEKLVAISHPAEFKVDNNHLLLLMIHVFRETEEQLVKMLKMSTGHMEGDLQSLYLLLTDCYIYLLRKGAAEKPYMVEDALSYNELDYISVGLDQQTVTLVCTNRRRQFLLDTADPSLTTWFLDVLKFAIMKGDQQPSYPAVLTDATMERLSLTKFVCQVSNCEMSDVCILVYSLVHWEDPLDVTAEPNATVNWCSNPSSIKEGPLLYRAGTTYMGKELWKNCYFVLSNGILHQYSQRTDRTPLLSISLGGASCGGCRRSSSTERPHAFQIILSERPPLELSANSEQDMADWMQVFCQSVSQGVIPQGVAPAPCIPCCLVLTDKKLLTCHQDCQTSFFRLLGEADLSDITSFCVERDKEYCIVEFAEDRNPSLLSWVLYFSSCVERDRLHTALERSWTDLFQVCLPQKSISDPSIQKRCDEALALMKSTWQRSDSLHRGRAQREPWC